MDAIAALVRRGAGVDLEVAGVTPLMHAALKSETEALAALVQRGANVECESQRGDTALVAAAREGKLGSLQALVEFCYAKPNRETAAGLTALLAAAAAGQVEAVTRLVELGAKVNPPATLYRDAAGNRAVGKFVSWHGPGSASAGFG